MNWRVVKIRVGFDAYDPGYFVYTLRDVDFSPDQDTHELKGDSVEDLKKLHREQAKAFNHPVMVEVHERAYFKKEKII